MKIAGVTSTGSKRPAALYGPERLNLPVEMVRSEGCRVYDPARREYLDFIMALGAVSLGYADPVVTAAVRAAIERGGIGPLAPIDEPELAAALGECLPWADAVRFLKTGAEAVAAAVRLARAATGRDRVAGCGYHGWLDLSSREPGVPGAIGALYRPIGFNDPEQARTVIKEVGDELAAVIIEPVVDGPPDREWLELLRAETERIGAALVFDEIKTGFRLAVGGAVERFGVVPDLAVYGKAMANGWPLSAVAGTDRFMELVERTWISSTLATEFVSLAAARATVDRIRRLGVPQHLERVGRRLQDGLRDLATKHPDQVIGAFGVPEMCYLRFADDGRGGRVAAECARRGVLFKRNAYNFVSLAHTDAEVDRCLAVVGEVLALPPG